MDRHLVTIPGELAGEPTRFAFDSGMGLEVVRSSLAERLGILPTGETYTGRRMSGEETTLPLAVAPSAGSSRTGEPSASSTWTGSRRRSPGSVASSRSGSSPRRR